MSRFFLGHLLLKRALRRFAIDSRHDTARSCGNQTPNNNVFLETDEIIRLTGNCRLGEDSRGFLEGGCGNKRACLQRRLGNALQNRNGLGNYVAFFFSPPIDLVILCPINLLTDQEGRFARVGNLDFLHHLATNHLDMLVVNLHTLKAVDFLNFLNQVHS